MIASVHGNEDFGGVHVSPDLTRNGVALSSTTVRVRLIGDQITTRSTRRYLRLYTGLVNEAKDHSPRPGQCHTDVILNGFLF